MSSDRKHSQGKKRGNAPAPASAQPAAQPAPMRASGEDEPQVSRTWMPLWLVVLLGLLFYWGALYMDRNAAAFSARVYEQFSSVAQVEAANPRSGPELLLALGKTKYEATCMPCHQASGLGVPGQFPPLAGSEWVNTPGAGRMIRIALHGLSGPITVKGQEWNAAMPPVGDVLTSEELAAVVSYIRQAWENKAPLVKPEQVEAVKKQVGARGPWSATELKAVPEAE